MPRPLSVSATMTSTGLPVVQKMAHASGTALIMFKMLMSKTGGVAACAERQARSVKSSPSSAPSNSYMDLNYLTPVEFKQQHRCTTIHQPTVITKNKRLEIIGAFQMQEFPKS
jgi:hypothetical protein